MEFERLGGVVPQRPDRVRRLIPGALADRTPHFVPVDRGLGREPHRVGRQVHPERDEHQRVEGRSDVAADGAQPWPRHPVLTPGGDVEGHRHQTEEHDEVEPGPLCGAGQSEQHTGAEPPPAHTQPRTPGCLVDAAVQQRVVHPCPHLVAVDDQCAEGRHDEEDLEAVQQGGARRHERDPVGDQQQPGDSADQRRAADPSHGPGHQGDHHHAQQRAGEPPAEAVVAEDRLADRDQLLAEPADGPPDRNRGCPRRLNCAASARPAARSASRRRSAFRHRWATAG